MKCLVTIVILATLLACSRQPSSPKDSDGAVTELTSVERTIVDQLATDIDASPIKIGNYICIFVHLRNNGKLEQLDKQPAAVQKQVLEQLMRVIAHGREPNVVRMALIYKCDQAVFSQYVFASLGEFEADSMRMHFEWPLLMWVREVFNQAEFAKIKPRLVTLREAQSVATRWRVAACFQNHGTSHDELAWLSTWRQQEQDSLVQAHLDIAIRETRSRLSEQSRNH